MFWWAVACSLVGYSPCGRKESDMTEWLILSVSFTIAYELKLTFIAAAAKSLQSCPTLCDPIDGSPPGSPIPGILQAILECVAISFSNARKWKVKVKSLSHVRLFTIPRIAAYQAPPVHGIFQARVLEWGAIAFSDFRGMYIIKGKQISIIFFQSLENIKTILAPEGHIRTSKQAIPGLQTL